jgi:hypothetical protein
MPMTIADQIPIPEITRRVVRVLDELVWFNAGESLSMARLTGALTPIMAEYGFEWDIAYGTNKLVYVHPSGFVWKFPRFRYSVLEMQEEYTHIKRLHQRDPVHLPVTQSLPLGMMLQESAAPDYTKYKADQYLIEDTAHALGVSDIFSDNVGFRADGNFVFIDVGCVYADRVYREVSNAT